MLLYALSMLGVLLTLSSAAAQCWNHGDPDGLRDVVRASDGRAEWIVKGLQNLLTVRTKKPIEVRITTALSRAPGGAQACWSADGHPTIVIHKPFLRELAGRASAYGQLGVLAHEISHLIRRHELFDPSNPTRKTTQRIPCREAELEADYYTGYILRKKGASKEDAVASLKAFEFASNHCYPARYQRVLRALEGWIDADDEERPRPAAASAPLNEFETRHSADILGQDIGFGTGGLNQQQCAQECLQRRPCVAFSYDKWNKWCFLKRNLKRFVPDPRSVVGVLKPLDVPPFHKRAPRWEYVADSTFDGSAIHESHLPDLNACGVTCREHQGCWMFSFFENSKMCRLFGAADGILRHAGAYSGYAAHETSSLVMSDDTDE